MYIIAGLGNPTGEYNGTRHNIGFEAVKKISEEYGIPLDFKKHKGLCGKGMIAGEKVILIQPQTYMNLSGECLREAADYYKVDNEHILVIYDDINLEPGKLRIRTSGSAGGHNGIKSIIAQLGTEGFPRIRIGVGEKPKGYDLAAYVLGHFSAEEKPVMQEAVCNAAKACELFLSEGAAAAMNAFNERNRSKQA